MREAAVEIARDEASHAELAWDVAAWITPLLSDDERAAVRRAMRDAVTALSNEAH